MRYEHGWHVGCLLWAQVQLETLLGMQPPCLKREAAGEDGTEFQTLRSHLDLSHVFCFVHANMKPKGPVTARL